MSNSMLCSVMEFESVKQAFLKFMETGQIDTGAVRPQIAESWQRCQSSGQSTIGQSSSCMLLKDLDFQKKLTMSNDLLRIANPIMESLYELVKGSGFVVSIANDEGVILQVLGDTEIMEKAKECNFIPGSKWTEAMVGTNAIGTGLQVKNPIQVCSYEHLWQQAQVWTSSAAPIYGYKGIIAGILTVAGTYEHDKVHSHTLGMVVAMAQAISNNIRVNKTLMQLNIANSYMKALMESIEEGILACDEYGEITQINGTAAKILRIEAEDLINKKISEVLPDADILTCAITSGLKYTDREILINTIRGKVHCVITCRPIMADNDETVGVVIVLKEIEAVRKLVNHMVGDRAKFTFKNIVGQNESFLQTVDLAKQAASSRSTVLLLGESGTGKEVFAQSIHNASVYSGGPFIVINCSAIPRELIASELFGYTEGAYTGARRGGSPGKFELANGGTVFLDEIGEMPFDMQAVLLRTLQEKTVVRLGGQIATSINTRVIAATNRDLEQEVEKGFFRKDLFYRLNIIMIKSPPLRERVDDIPLLVTYFLKKLYIVYNKKIKY